MVSIELVKTAARIQPDAELTKQVVQAAAARGLILLSCGIYGMSFAPRGPDHFGLRC